jgi:hypothetical protein
MERLNRSFNQTVGNFEYPHSKSRGRSLNDDAKMTTNFRGDL